MLLYKIFTKTLSHVFTRPGSDNKTPGSVVYHSTKPIMVFLIQTGYKSGFFCLSLVRILVANFTHMPTLNKEKIRLYKKFTKNYPALSKHESKSTHTLIVKFFSLQSKIRYCRDKIIQSFMLFK